MAKIAYNACFGGFGLSPAALKRWAALKGRECYFFVHGRSANGGTDFRSYVRVEPESINSIFWTAFDIPSRPSADYDAHHLSGRDIPRNDPHLIQVIEEMGSGASGSCAQLKIAEIPDGAKYRIDEYDGSESVMTPDDYEWQTA